MAITLMREYSASKKKKAPKGKRKYNSFEHRVLSGLRDGKSDYIFDIEHMNKIKELLKPNESIWIDKLSSSFYIRMATNKERDKAYFKWCKLNKYQHNVQSVHQFNKEEKLIWSAEQ